MAAFHPRAEDLPGEIAVFPLPGALLLPRGKLPLNIFEPRYLAMTEDALAHRRMFGMIQPDATRKDGPAGPALYRVGCLGRLVSFNETEDGRFLITLAGVIRFAVATELEMRRGYRRVRPDYAMYLGDLAAETQADVARDTIEASLRAYFTRAGIDANWDAIRRIPDDALVVSLAMLCPFAPVEKQALLEAVSDRERAETLLTLLRMGATGADDSGQRRTLS